MVLEDRKMLKFLRKFDRKIGRIILGEDNCLKVGLTPFRFMDFLYLCLIGNQAAGL